MTRKLFLTILIAVLASLFTTNVHAASDNNPVHMFYAEFDGESGQFYGAFNNGVNGWQAIAWEALDENTQVYEDFFAREFTATLELGTDGMYNGIFSYTSEEYSNQTLDFAWRYLDDSDIGTIASAYTVNGISYGTLNGDQAQFYGPVDNGAVYLLREAKLNCNTGCQGFIVQNGKLVAFALCEKESPAYHKVYMPVVTR